MTPAKMLYVPIDNAAIGIESALQQILKPYPVGIYIKGNELPSIVPNEYFYRIDRSGRGKVREIEVKTIDDIQGNIYNEDGEIVISDRVANNKHRMLSTLPTIPAYGRKIARAAIRNFLDYVQIYKNVRSIEDGALREVFEELINPNYDNLKTWRQFQDIVKQNMADHIFPSIREFIGEESRTWNVLIPSFDRDTAKVENNGDFRIHKYMEEHGDEHPQ